VAAPFITHATPKPTRSGQAITQTKTQANTNTAGPHAQAGNKLEIQPPHEKQVRTAIDHTLNCQHLAIVSGLQHHIVRIVITSAFSGHTGEREEGSNPPKDSMTTLRRFTCDDLLRFNNVNFDVLTETVCVFAWAWLPAVDVRAAFAVQHRVLPRLLVDVAGLPAGRGIARQPHHGIHHWES
jgi:hypothetical protein